MVAGVYNYSVAASHSPLLLQLKIDLVRHIGWQFFHHVIGFVFSPL